MNGFKIQKSVIHSDQLFIKSIELDSINKLQMYFRAVSESPHLDAEYELLWWAVIVTRWPKIPKVFLSLDWSSASNRTRVGILRGTYITSDRRPSGRNGT